MIRIDDASVGLAKGDYISYSVIALHDCIESFHFMLKKKAAASRIFIHESDSLIATF